MPNIYLLIPLVFLISFIIQTAIIIFSKKRGFCIDLTESDKPQRFHDLPISRSGGLGIFVSFVLGAIIYDSSIFNYGLPLVISSLPVFIAGFYEDLNPNTSHKFRLVMIAIGAIAGFILLDGLIFDIGFLVLPLWVAIPFTIFAVVGASNAINIIDGFNGLASGISIIALLSYIVTSYLFNDQATFNLCIIFIAAIGGFFIQNFPKGRIFLGDGGAYFTGFMLAQISILLVKRNTGISPWFPIAILTYPIFEVLFSIYRRKFKRGISAFEPDAAHLHTLIYRRITRVNAKTSIYIWTIVLIFNLLALLFYSNEPMLILIFLFFSLVYLYIYRKIVRFNINPDRKACPGGGERIRTA